MSKNDNKNVFGGGNAGSLYTPMSEDEQEVIARLIEADDLQVVIVGWGYVDHPRVTFGDLRVSLAFRMTFDKPDIPMPVHYFDLELRTRSGLLLFKQRQTTEYDGRPIEVAAGVFLDMIWDIAIKAMDPNLVKQIKPGAKGLTSRWQDRDTGGLTDTGNVHLPPEQRALLAKLRAGEALARKDTKQQAVKSAKKAGY